MSETDATDGADDPELALLISVLSFGIVLFLLVPGATGAGSVPTANLYLSVPFVFISIFCFQFVLESIEYDDSERQSRERRRRS